MIIAFSLEISDIWQLVLDFKNINKVYQFYLPKKTPLAHVNFSHNHQRRSIHSTQRQHSAAAAYNVNDIARENAVIISFPRNNLCEGTK